MGYYLSISLSQRSQNIESNTTKVEVSVIITATQGYYAEWRGSCSGVLNLNGASYPFNTSYYIKSSSQTIYRVEVDIPHNADGTKYVSATATFNAKPSQVGVLTASNSWTLNTIPRGSKIASISGSEFGDMYTIKWTPASDTFTHRVYWHILSEKEHSWVLVGTGLTNQCSFKVPQELCSKIPNDGQTALTISLETYAGTTKIWDEIKTYTIKVPTSVVPTIESKTITEGNSSLPGEFYGLWVQSISRPKININAKGIYGSTIKSIKTTFEEASYDGNEVIFNPIKADGQIKSKTIVTDSRGRITEYTHTYNVVPYHEPQIKKLTFAFCDENGRTDPSGTFIKISVAGNIAAVNNTNLHILNVKWRKQTAQNFASKNVPINSYEFDISTIIGGFDSTLTYELMAELYDARSKSTTSMFTGKIIISRYPGGDGIALFKEAERVGLDIGTDKIYIADNSLADFLTDKGIKNGWQYKRTYGGEVELTKTFDISNTSYGEFNGWKCYYHEIALPFDLKGVYISASWNVGTGLAISSNVISLGNNRYRLFCIASQGGGSISIQISVMAKGKIERG